MTRPILLYRDQLYTTFLRCSLQAKCCAQKISCPPTRIHLPQPEPKKIRIMLKGINDKDFILMLNGELIYIHAPLSLKYLLIMINLMIMPVWASSTDPKSLFMIRTTIDPMELISKVIHPIHIRQEDEHQF
ncbi:hypothetical protein ACJX0J_009223 [Zea mays]